MRYTPSIFLRSLLEVLASLRNYQLVQVWKWILLRCSKIQSNYFSSSTMLQILDKVDTSHGRHVDERRAKSVGGEAPAQLNGQNYYKYQFPLITS